MIVMWAGHERTARSIGVLANGKPLLKLVFGNGTSWKFVVPTEQNGAGRQFVRGASIPEILGARIDDDGPGLDVKHARHSNQHYEKGLWKPVEALLVARRMARRKER